MVYKYVCFRLRSHVGSSRLGWVGGFGGDGVNGDPSGSRGGGDSGGPPGALGGGGGTLGGGNLNGSLLGGGGGGGGFLGGPDAGVDGQGPGAKLDMLDSVMDLLADTPWFQSQVRVLFGEGIVSI